MNPCPSYLHLRLLEIQGYTRTLGWDWKRCSKHSKFWDVVYNFLATTSVIHKNVQGFDYSRERTSTFKPSSSGIGCRAQPTCDGPPTPPLLTPPPHVTRFHSSTTRSSKAPRPAGVAVNAPPLSSQAIRGPLLWRGLGRKRRGRDRGGPQACGLRGPGRDQRTPQVSAPLLARQPSPSAGHAPATGLCPAALRSNLRARPVP